MTTTTEEKPKTKRPVETLRFGRIQASVWENEGRDGKYHTVTFERRYKAADGNWKGSHGFRHSELLALAKACDKAHDVLGYLAAEQRAAEAK